MFNLKILKSWKQQQKTIKICSLVFLALFILYSCQKDEIVSNTNEEDVTTTSSLKSGSISIAYIDWLIQSIQDYATAGDLDQGIANSLISKLENAKASLERGNENVAMNLIQAVLNQLESLVDGGIIDPEVGEEIIFETGVVVEENPTMTDPRDGHEYEVVLIGEQIWMAENLAYLPVVSPPLNCSSTEPYYYVNSYDGTDVSAAKETDNYKTYGVLYNWSAAMNACPDGWHLPSDAEWEILENYLIDNGYGYGGSGDDIAYELAAQSFLSQDLFQLQPALLESINLMHFFV